VTGLAIDDYSRTMMDKTLAELKEEQAGVASMLG
jgi:malate dehydrogenase